MSRKWYRPEEIIAKLRVCDRDAGRPVCGAGSAGAHSIGQRAGVLFQSGAGVAGGSRG